MGFEMKRLQSSVVSHLRKTLNIHTRLPAVPQKKENSSPSRDVSLKTDHSYVFADWRRKVDGKSQLCCVTRHPLLARDNYRFTEMPQPRMCRDVLFSDWCQSTWRNIIQKYSSSLPLQKRWVMGSLCIAFLNLHQSHPTQISSCVLKENQNC